MSMICHARGKPLFIILNFKQLPCITLTTMKVGKLHEITLSTEETIMAATMSGSNEVVMLISSTEKVAPNEQIIVYQNNDLAVTDYFADTNLFMTITDRTININKLTG
jgi:hypothetical protein